jgi:hypothetical protein
MTPLPAPSSGTDWPTLITAIAAAIAAVVALLALVIEGRRSRLQIGIQNLWRLIEYWDDPDLRRLRARLARRLLSDPSERNHVRDDGIDVLNTFELLGYLVRSKTLSLEDAWINFSVWANSWWFVYEEGIKKLRVDDATVYQDYAALVDRFLDYESEKRSLPRELIEPSEEILTKFLESEYRLLTRIRQRRELVESLRRLLGRARPDAPSRRPSPASDEDSGLGESS